MKVSPFYRTTQNQIQQFYLNQQTSFVSGLNVGKQTSRGIEFELDKGNFNANGLSARLSFTYTNSYINYTTPDSGLERHHQPQQRHRAVQRVHLVLRRRIPTNAKCGGTGNTVTAAPVLHDGRQPRIRPAPPTYVANPYWNAPVQNLLSETANYATFDILPAGIGSAVAGYGAPVHGLARAQRTSQ